MRIVCLLLATTLFLGCSEVGQKPVVKPQAPKPAATKPQNEQHPAMKAYYVWWGEHRKSCKECTRTDQPTICDSAFDRFTKAMKEAMAESPKSGLQITGCTKACCCEKCECPTCDCGKRKPKIDPAALLSALLIQDFVTDQKLPSMSTEEKLIMGALAKLGEWFDQKFMGRGGVLEKIEERVAAIQASLEKQHSGKIFWLMMFFGLVSVTCALVCINIIVGWINAITKPRI